MLNIYELSMILVFLFIGSFCQATTGFGFGLICIGLLTIFLSVKECLLIINTLTIVMSFLILWRYRTYIRLKSLVIWLLPAAIAGRTLAFVSLKFFGEMDWAKKALGLFLLLMVVYLILQKRRSRDQTQDLRWERPGFAMGSGLLAGFIGGAFAGGGPFLVVYFLMKYADKKYYIANLQVVFFLQSIFYLWFTWDERRLYGSRRHIYAGGHSGGYARLLCWCQALRPAADGPDPTGGVYHRAHGCSQRYDLLGIMLCHKRLQPSSNME